MWFKNYQNGQDLQKYTAKRLLPDLMEHCIEY